MGDFLLQVSQNARARRIIKRLGLPIPLPQKLRRASGPWEERPLHDRAIVAALRDAGPVAAHVADALPAAGANLVLVCEAEHAGRLRGAGEAYGRPVQHLSPGQASDGRADGLVFDATGLASPSDLRALYDFFHPWVGRLNACGRVVVIGRPPSGLAPAAAAVQAALDGFVRSVGKEIGKQGSTANLVQVDAGAEARLPAVLCFLLSDHSAFVSGQPFHVSLRARGSGTARTVVRGLEGKVALVTGAARGIGEAIARSLAGEGAHVVCLDRPADDGPVSQVARDVGGSVLLADVSDPEAPARVADHLRTRFGGVDVVVHNAGVTRDKTLVRMTAEQWDQALDINFAAVLRLSAALFDGLLRDGGRVVCLSSVAGLAGNVGQTNYAASKAGVAGWVRAVAPTVASRGITVNALAPGFIETRLTMAIPVALREAARRMSSLRQGGQPRDVAEVVTFLASPGAVGLTGNVIRVCGQMLAGA